MLEPQFGDIFEWPHGGTNKVMFIRRDGKYKTKSALNDTMTGMTLVPGTYGGHVGAIRSGIGPVEMYRPIEQRR